MTFYCGSCYKAIQADSRPKTCPKCGKGMDDPFKNLPEDEEAPIKKKVQVAKKRVMAAAPEGDEEYEGEYEEIVIPSSMEILVNGQPISRDTSRRKKFTIASAAQGELPPTLGSITNIPE